MTISLRASRIRRWRPTRRPVPTAALTPTRVASPNEPQLPGGLFAFVDELLEVVALLDFLFSAAWLLPISDDFVTGAAAFNRRPPVGLCLRALNPFGQRS